VEKSDNLSVNFAPAAAKLIIVDSHFYRSWTFFWVLSDTNRFEFGAV
jgi:hypothetical protein